MAQARMGPHPSLPSYLSQKKCSQGLAATKLLKEIQGLSLMAAFLIRRWECIASLDGWSIGPERILELVYVGWIIRSKQRKSRRSVLNDHSTGVPSRQVT
ncbi:unnamed protein product [Polarella glacialis]|uniref:Uncharacterized protein n=1 Tax=Polarella glacialis TaxID=89957 RepID=A0A813IMQ2_POLGL|nr:unnamed protein product [Polarella glacialis]